MRTENIQSDLDEESISELLSQIRNGHREAEQKLIPLVYGELRRLARYYMRLERAGHTLQATDLVHEAYTHLVKQQEIPWTSRAHFFATAAHAMRHILVDHARARNANKRGGGQKQVALDDAVVMMVKDRTIDVLVLDEALERLSVLDQRQARLVELHFFAGLTFTETALVLDISERTAKREWSMAKAWLKGELSK